MTTDERFMDTQQVAEYLGVHEKQVYTLIHDRGLPATKITGKWLFPGHLVDRWLESNVINMPETQPFLKAAGSLLLIAGSDDPLLVKLTALFNKRFPEMLVLLGQRLLLNLVRGLGYGWRILLIILAKLPAGLPSWCWFNCRCWFFCW